MTGQERGVFYTESGFTVDSEKTADKSAYYSESLLDAFRIFGL